MEGINLQKLIDMANEIIEKNPEAGSYNIYFGDTYEGQKLGFMYVTEVPEEGCDSGEACYMKPGTKYIELGDTH